jgi:hypothetical protein
VSGPTRRSLLKRALVGAGALFGLGTVGDAGAATGSRLVLHVDGWPAAGRNGLAAVEAGRRQTTRSAILDGPGGRRVGELYTVAFAVRSTGSLEPALVDRIEQHTFRLQDGTILGSGTADGADGAFAVVGGTGRYAGASGTYEVVVRDGAATFTFSLLA